MKRSLAVGAVLVVVVAACGNGDGAAPTTTAGLSTTTTASAVTTTTTATTVPAVTTSTQASTTTTTTIVYRADPASLASPDPLPGSEGAAGSGCAPGSGALPDGIWFGLARSLSPSTVTFDLACMYFGDAAVTAAAGDGVTDVPNDYYIRNENPATRAVPVDAAATVWTIGADPTDGLEQVSYAGWPLPGETYTVCPGESCTVWLYINGGRVTEIMEQYLP